MTLMSLVLSDLFQDVYRIISSRYQGPAYLANRKILLRTLNPGPHLPNANAHGFFALLGLRLKAILYNSVNEDDMWKDIAN